MKTVSGFGFRLGHLARMAPMATEQEISEAAAKATAEAVLGGSLRATHSLMKLVELRVHAKSKTDLRASELSAEQTVWKAIYESVTNLIRQTDPSALENADALQADLDALDSFQRAVEGYKAANTHEYGYKVPIGFMIVGTLLAFLRSPDVTSVLVGAVVSWIAGFCFSVFVLNSEIQLKIGFQLEGTMFKRIGRWFIHHTLKNYAVKK
jgi:hypothetical protein